MADSRQSPFDPYTASRSALEAAYLSAVSLLRTQQSLTRRLRESLDDMERRVNEVLALPRDAMADVGGMEPSHAHPAPTSARPCRAELVFHQGASVTVRADLG